MNSSHNPDQYMVSLRQIVAQGRKRIGLLVGAGAAAGISQPGGTEPLIPAVAGLTDHVCGKLAGKYRKVFAAIASDLGGNNPNIEQILTRVRSLCTVIGKTTVHGLDGDGYRALGDEICWEIGCVVNQDLPAGPTPYSQLVSWISGTDRDHAIEIFTTNYDLLFEKALERARIPYFDGFVGASEPFFDPSTVASDQLPPRWVRLWKLHGSLGWKANDRGAVIRDGQPSNTHLVYPVLLKYDQTQKAPYAALFDRLRQFLMTPDTLLIATGFSFADAHISARIDECLAANPSASLFAFQYSNLDDALHACEIASRRPNMSVYAPDKAMINGIPAEWRPGEQPTKDWGPIRATYWGQPNQQAKPQFLLGQFDQLTGFFAAAHTRQIQVLPSIDPSSPPLTMTP